MRRAFLSALAAAVMTLPALPSDFGIGVSFKGSDTALYLPMRINPGLRLEAMLGYDRQAVHQDAPNVPANLGYSYLGSASGSAASLGLGVFAVRPVGEHLHLYYGPRIAYLRQWNNLTITFVPNATDGAELNRQESTSNGLTASAIFGLEYPVAGSFTVAGEVGVEYGINRTANRSTVTGIGTMSQPGGNSRLNTISSILLRYYF